MSHRTYLKTRKEEMIKSAQLTIVYYLHDDVHEHTQKRERKSRGGASYD